WFALADTGWRIGRLDEEVRKNALRIIDSGQDLTRWENSGDRTKREQVLAKLRARLLTPQPAPKHIAKPFKAANDWNLGEVLGFQLVSGRWVLLRLIGHHVDRGGRSAICELLNWTGDSLLSHSEIEGLEIRREKSPRGISQF